MTKRKSVLAYILAICLIVPAVFMMTACGEKKHNHTFSPDWTPNETHHWHAATCEHTDEKGDYAEHDFGAWTEKTPASLHQNKIEERKCKVCEFTETRPVEDSALHDFSSTWEKDATNHWHECACGAKGDITPHEFGSWSVKTSEALHQNRIEKRTCEVCGYEETNEIENTAIHTYSDWKRDSNKHWKESTCEGHSPALIIEESAHTFGAWTEETPADYGVNRIDKHTCITCGYEATQEVPNSALAPKTNNITVEEIGFVYSGESQSIDSLITANNSVGMTIKYQGVGDTTYAESTTAPTNAGKYQYTISIPATAEWAKGEKTDTFTIAKYSIQCPAAFVSSVTSADSTTNVLCEIDLSDDENINLDEVMLTHKSKSIGAGRLSNLDKNNIVINNPNVQLINIPTTIDWIVKDESDSFGFRVVTPLTAGSYYQGTVQHGYVEVGDKLIVVGTNNAGTLTKVNVTVTKIEYKENYKDNYIETTVATKGETVKITFTKDNDSANIISCDYIIKAHDMGEINNYDANKTKTTPELNSVSSEYRMFRLKVGTTNNIQLTITNTDTCAFVKVLNAETLEEITLTDNKFQVADGTEVLILVKQITSNGTHQITASVIEYTIG